jgi:TetR/AcrR family transcriptional regulator, transcriptional repressor for nem operon
MEATITRAPAVNFTTKGQATRQRITEVAARLMFERGVAGTSLEDVFAEAGVSSSQIYHYFGDKHGLIRAVVQFQAKAALLCTDPLASTLDSFEALRAWARFHVEVQIERHCVGGCAFGSLVSQVTEIEPDTQADFSEGFQTWQGTIASGLAAMQDRGDLPATAVPEDLAVSLFAALQGGLIMTQAQRNPRLLEIALDTALNHIESLAQKTPELA